MKWRMLTIAGLALLLAGGAVTVGYEKACAHVFNCADFVTGGGFWEPRFEGGPANRVNVGFNAGSRNGDRADIKGHFNLVDHNDGTHIDGVNVDTYVVCFGGDPKCRRFEGDAKINGVPGFRYQVNVCDYGEPGRDGGKPNPGDDRIRVTASNGYFADNFSSGKTCPAGAPNCGDLDGGNFQLHKACPTCPE